MPVEIEGQTYYKVSEASQLSGMSRSTIHRWIHEGIITGGKLRNRAGWRLFSEEDITEIKAEAGRVWKEPD
ncbi:MAG: MerR family transcriptional regulator [Chloroflexi bacterium]|nr:MerR family transcriptional regulator [Chloroflexota bacterium]